MCGVAGSFQFQPSRNQFQIDEPYLINMRDTMIHRGPDGCGLWINNEKDVGLAHRRLSIIDLSEKASQPMLSSDGRYALTFNGEIYNHSEIKEELIKLGITDWQTDHSDTEVLLQSYIHWGEDCLNHFKGMFAFAIWDDQKKELFVARDRMGIKPLYYTIQDGRFVFASEIKALLKDPAYTPEVNEKAFYHFLSFLTTPAPETLFKGISKLPSGHKMLIKNGNEPTSEPYWDVFDNVKPMDTDDEEKITKGTIEKLKKAVEYRKIGDVPVGVFLSGGIDSSTNAALFSDKGKEKIKTFSIGYDSDYGSYKNELHFAKEVADLIKSDHFEKRLTVDDLLDFLPKMIELQDEPIADPVCVPVYYVSKLARDNGVTVCQVGEGADELFWGYRSWQAKYYLAQLNDFPVPNIFKKGALKLLKLSGKEKTESYELLRRGVEGQPVFWGGAEAFTETQKQQLLSKEFKNRLGKISSWDVVKTHFEKFKATCKRPTNLNWMSYLDLKLRLPELLLMRVDKMSMGVSLEARVPFLDHEFIEYAMGIPTGKKTKRGISKYILKKAVRGLIPDKIIDRKKQGFGVPVHEWLLERLGDEMKAEIRSFAKETKYFNPEYIEGLIEQKKANQLWYLYNFVLWHKTYIGNHSTTKEVS